MHLSDEPEILQEKFLYACIYGELVEMAAIERVPFGREHNSARVMMPECTIQVIWLDVPFDTIISEPLPVLPMTIVVVGNQRMHNVVSKPLGVKTIREFCLNSFRDSSCRNQFHQVCIIIAEGN